MIQHEFPGRQSIACVCVDCQKTELNHNRCMCPLQSNFNGSNTFGTMTISSRQGLFEPLRVYYRARSGGIIGVSLRFLFIMKVYCVFSLESPQRGHSNEYTKYTIFHYKKEYC